MSVLVSLCLLACSEQSAQIDATKNIDKAISEPVISEIEKGTLDAPLQFDTADARNNLTFVKDQYLKMIASVDANKNLKLAQSCEKEQAICFPRAMEHNAIYMERLTKWTNGFYPGLLWKLLAVNQDISGFTLSQKEKVLSKAQFYQAALISETKRGSTHDLGFLLNDSFGEALEYAELSEDLRSEYQEALAVGRNTLATRYDEKVGLIKSWDWEAQYLAHIKNGEQTNRLLLSLAKPWAFPVIVDNMMNLEYMFDSTDQAHRDLAYSHAKHTLINHYFYEAGDADKQFPIAYHVFDYGEMKPGNWQGAGNISAWARGQGWSLYGYVTVLEALKVKGTDLDIPDFDSHVKRLVASIEKLLGDEFVPDWDYYAERPDAAEIAANQHADTARYSHLLGLCDFQIENDILPYVGYAPIKVDKSIIADDTLAFLADKKSVYGEDYVHEDFVAPCGTQAYDITATHIPKDTSAAALYAAALYRLALHTEDKVQKDKAVLLADNIMAELTNNYLTSKAKGQDYDLGFVLAEATGNLPNASEINTSIVYADFYFLEANILKLEVAKTQ